MVIHFSFLDHFSRSTHTIVQLYTVWKWRVLQFMIFPFLLMRAAHNKVFSIIRISILKRRDKKRFRNSFAQCLTTSFSIFTPFRSTIIQIAQSSKPQCHPLFPALPIIMITFAERCWLLRIKLSNNTLNIEHAHGKSF